MKKGLTLGLVLVFALAIGLGLVACGSEAEESTTSVTETSTTVAAQQPIALKYATTFTETEAGGRTVQYFCDRIKELTGGAVTFEINFGGTLGTSTEELGLVSSGSVDMISLDHAACADELPLLSFPRWVPATLTPSKVIDYFNNLVFYLEPSAGLIQDEAEAHNIMYLGFTAGGGSVFIAKEPFTALSDLVGKKFGAAGSSAPFEDLGYTVVLSSPSETQEKLSSGVIEATHMAFVPSVDLKLYEVAKGYMSDGMYAAGGAFTINIDTWAKLTPEAKQAMYRAAKDSEIFSIDLDASDTAARTTSLTDAGVTLGKLSSQDATTWYQALFDASAADCLTRAKALGVTDDMIAVLTAAADFAKVTWTPPAQ